MKREETRFSACSSEQQQQQENGKGLTSALVQEECSLSIQVAQHFAPTEKLYLPFSLPSPSPSPSPSRHRRRRAREKRQRPPVRVRLRLSARRVRRWVWEVPRGGGIGTKGTCPVSGETLAQSGLGGWRGRLSSGRCLSFLEVIYILVLFTVHICTYIHILSVEYIFIFTSSPSPSSLPLSNPPFWPFSLRLLLLLRIVVGPRCGCTWGV
jgi:hypothetical protein